MGLQIFDLTFHIEHAFKIEMSMDDLDGLVKDNDIAVGDLYEFVLKRLHLHEVGRRSVRVNLQLWREMQHALHRATQVPLEQIELGLALESLFPRENRRALWDALRETCPYRVRELDYPKLVRRGCLLAAVAVVAVEQLQIWQIPGAIWLWHLLTIVAIWTVSEMYLKLLSICAPWRTSFPADIKTVKDLCRSVMSANYEEICQGAELVLDDRSAVVWRQLVACVVDALGVDAADVTFESRLVRDLGAG